MMYDSKLLKNDINILDVASKYLPNLIKKGREWATLCCFHDEKSPSMLINEEKGVFFCQACGAKGDAIDLHKKFDSSSSNFGETVESICLLLGLNPEDYKKGKTRGLPKKGKRALRDAPPPTAQKQEFKPAPLSFNDILFSELDVPLLKPRKYRVDNNIWGIEKLCDGKYVAKKGMAEKKEIKFDYSETTEYFNFTKPNAYPCAYEKRVEYFDKKGDRITKETMAWTQQNELAKPVNKINDCISRDLILPADYHRWHGQLQGKAIILAEGIDCIQGLINLNFAATSLLAGVRRGEDRKRAVQIIKDEGVSVLVQLIDNDQPGIAYGKEIEEYCNELGLPFLAVRMVDLYPSEEIVPDKADIKDYLSFLKEMGLTLTRELVQEHLMLAAKQALNRKNESINQDAIVNLIRPVSDIPRFDKYKETINVNQRYLQPIAEIVPETAQIIFINSPIGTNKTGATEEFLRNCGNDIALIIPTLRNSLKDSLGTRFGVYTGDKFVYSQTLIKLGLCCCVDSLHGQTNKYEFKIEDIILALFNFFLDECTQVFRHALLANTDVAKHRPEVIFNIIQLIRAAIKHGTKLIFADAHITPDFIDFIKAITLDLNPEIAIINNTYQPHKGKRVLYIDENSKPFQIVKMVVDAVLRGERVYLYVVGQKATSQCGTINFESELIKQGILAAAILRIDRESIGNKDHDAFQITKNLERINDYQVIIASPTMETGVDLNATDFKFDKVFGISYGLTPVTSFLQGMGRVRFDCPHFIWAPKKATSRGCLMGHGELTFEEMKASQSREIKSAKDSLKAFASSCSLDILDEVDDLFSHGTTPETLASIVNDYRIKIAVQHNILQQDYRENLIKYAERDGYEIKYLDQVDPEELKATKDSINETRDKNITAYREKVTAAKIIDDYTFEQLGLKEALTEKESYECDRYRITKATGIEELNNEVFDIYEKALPELNNIFHFGLKDKGIAIAREQDAIAFESVKGKTMFGFDLMKRFKGYKISEIGQALELDKFLDPDFTINSQEAATFIFDKVIPAVKKPSFGSSKLAKDIRKIALSYKMKPMSRLQAIINLVFGKRLERTGRISVDKKRSYCFSGITLTATERQILNNWYKNHSEKIKVYRENTEELKSVADWVTLVLHEKDNSSKNTMLEAIFGAVKKEDVFKALSYVGNGLKDIAKSVIEQFLSQPGYVFL